MDTRFNQNIRSHSSLWIAGVILLMLIGVMLVANAFSRYTSDQLYQESCAQLSEITEQNYEKLSVVLDEQWRYTEALEALFMESAPASIEELARTMHGARLRLSPIDDSYRFVMLDSESHFYTENGERRLWKAAEALDPSLHHQSMLASIVGDEGNRMAFADRLGQPITLHTDSGDVVLTHIILMKQLESLTGYFRCSAFNNQNVTFVLKNNGVKMYSDFAEDVLSQSYNVFDTLRTFSFPHSGSLDACLEQLDETGEVCTDVAYNDNTYFLCLKRPQGYSWTLLFIVDADLVAASTGNMLNSLIQVFILTLLLLMTASCFAIFFVMKSRRNQELYAVETKTAAELSRANQSLELSRRGEQHARQTAEDALRIAQSANRAKTAFLANMSHDIRTPMNAIVGISDLMEHELNEPSESCDPAKLLGYIHKIQLSSRHLLGLINDILDMSKIESNEASLNAEPLNIAAAIGQLDGIIRPQAAARDQRFRIVTHDVQHENVIGDSMRLQQILLNVLSNAVKYTPEGGSIQLDLSELSPSNPAYVRYSFAITDNGIGMSEEFLQHIFEPFTRVENSVTNKIQGTGLGMAITKSIVDMMGGTLRVESRPGEGSRFTITLEFKLDPETDGGISRMNVLLLASEPLLITNVLATAAHKPVTIYPASDVDEAARVMQHSDITAALLSGDITADVVRRLREASASPVLLFRLDYIPPEKTQEILDKTGVDGLIPRPFFFSNLESEIERARGARTAGDGSDASILKGMRFLCAEDNELNAEILQALLELAGADCTICANGQEIVDAFEKVKPGDYDAILMDVQMPVMNGYEATRRIRAGENPLGQTIPILAMTANAFSDDIQQSMEAGMDAHISKPVDMKVLEATVRSFCVTPPRIRDERTFVRNAKTEPHGDAPFRA